MAKVSSGKTSEGHGRNNFWQKKGSGDNRNPAGMAGRGRGGGVVI